ncbi:MAG: hypothetical protein FWG71_11130, partial [Synergistaceae bacterium]|nr:hypothetical protein [Synergistaceae bacterium]
MVKQYLCGEWRLDIPGWRGASGQPSGQSSGPPFGRPSGQPIAARVPGSVYSALLENGLMPDPFWRDNELDALKIMEHDFIFTHSFDVELPEFRQFLLVCEGLDTICDVELNGEFLGHAENMHRTWEFDVTKSLRPKGNLLKLTFRSPTKAIAERYAAVPTDGSCDAMRGFPQLRKAHCMFGWDWGPRHQDAGVWRDIYIAGVGGQRIESVYVTQRHDGGKVELSFKAETTGGCPVSFAVTSPSGETLHSGGGPIVIEDPELWWPNGYGAQPLYTVRAEVPGDAWERRIGLRTITFTREKDQWGESFALTVNGLPIFAMGADYIPHDNILSRVTPERIRALLEDCAAVNFNVIRVWGGGIYPGDAFFDICDELGLVVWQDFMFACGIYELTPEFEENIRAEFIDNIKRIRHHASLGLWCGNNELEWQYGDDSFEITPKQRADYTRIFGYIIPKTLREHDPNTFHWPASPSSGGDFDDPNDENRGNVHYWEVWHGGKPFSAYRDYHFRFCSEFGFQSFPCLKTVKSFTEDGDRNVFSRVMEMHQRNTGANGRTKHPPPRPHRHPPPPTE